MSVPGKGLLAMLSRKKPEVEDPKFAARSSAVHAIEQSVAAGDAPEVPKKQAKGRAIPRETLYTYDLDSKQPTEEQPGLTVNPVTKVPADYVQAQRRQVAVSDRFITYGLKPGHIRVLHRFSEARALLKGHTAPIEDIRFLDDEILVAGGPDGQLFAWRLSVTDGDNAVHVQQLLHVKISAAGKTGRVIIASGGSPELPLFFVASAGVVLAVKKVTEGSDKTIDLAEGVPNTDVLAIVRTAGHGEPTALAVSPDGRVLLAGTARGEVLQWLLPAESTSSPHDAAGHAVQPTSHETASDTITGLHFLPPVDVTQQNGSSTTSDDDYVYVVGTKDNTHLEVVHLVKDGDDVEAESLQRIHLTSKDGKSYIHTDVVAAQHLVVLADTPRKSIYTLHYSGSGAQCRVDYIARFGVGLPVLNFTALWDPDAGEDGAIELTCVQTEAVQQYSLDHLMCFDSSAVEQEAEEEEEATQVIEDTTTAPEPTELPPPPTTSLLANGGTTPGSAAAVAAAQRQDSYTISSEGCPSPPPTPVDTSLVTEMPPPVTLAAPSPDNLPQPNTTTTPPRLLTPEDLLKRPGGGGSASGRVTPEQKVSPRKPTPPVTATAPVQILTRPVPQADLELADMEEESPDRSESASAAGAAPVSVGGDELSAALSREMAGVHRKFAGHVSAMYKELLKAMRADLAASAQANQIALQTALAAQREMVKEERAAVLAEERAGTERLISAISTTLNQDLPTRLSEALRAELATVTESMAASVTPAVQQAVHAALPKEVSGAVKTALDKQLQTAVQAGFTKPLQDAFRGAFSKQIVPAFENACQSMFLQVNNAFTQGFEEHLQSARTSLAEPVALSRNLKESLDSAQGLISAMRQEQQIMRTSSISSMHGGMMPRSPTAPLVVDVRADLKGLVNRGQYDEAFSRALSMQDVNIVSWLCGQTSAAELLSKDPPALSQMVLLSLIQQLAAGLPSGVDASVKLQWIREAALALNPRDPVLSPHLGQVLQQVHAALQGVLGRLSKADASSCKLAMHVVHSQMTT